MTIVSCDLKELIGSAIALELLFAIPLPWGVLLTAAMVGQVVLSLRLPFAVLPLALFCGRDTVMGELRAPRWLQWLGW